MAGRPPWSPPIVELADGIRARLLCWEQHARDGSWWAWVSWIPATELHGRPRHLVVVVRAGSVRPLEHPEAYRNVPRRIRGRDGQVRPWTAR